MRHDDWNNPYRQALAANHARQKHTDSSVTVVLVVLGLMALGLFVFAFIGDNGFAPADLTDTATGAVAAAE